MPSTAPYSDNADDDWDSLESPVPVNHQETLPATKEVGGEKKKGDSRQVSAATRSSQGEMKQEKRFHFSTDQDDDEVEQVRAEEVEESQQSQQSTVLTLPGQARKKPMEGKKGKVLIGIISHNNETSIGKTIVLVGNLGGEVLVCDDGSTDTSEDIAGRMGGEVIKHPRPLGRSDSIASLFLAARRKDADALLTIAADSSFKLKDLEDLLDAVQCGKCDIAIGSTVLSPEALDAKPQLTNAPIKDRTSIIRAYGKKAIQMVAPIDLRQVVLIEEKILEAAEQQNLRIKEFPLSLHDTKHEVSTKKARKDSAFFRLASYIAVEHPLPFFSSISLIFLAAAVFQSALTLYALLRTPAIIPQFGLGLAIAMFALYALFAIAAAVLHSQKVSREEAKKKDSSY